VLVVSVGTSYAKVLTLPVIADDSMSSMVSGEVWPSALVTAGLTGAADIGSVAPLEAR
jgi:hypothetical protein